MPYSKEVVDALKKAPKTLGTQLGRWAIHLDLPITKLAKATGATRMTMYNWFAGGTVTHGYRERVGEVLSVLRSCSTKEEAWRKLCQQYHLKG